MTTEIATLQPVEADAPLTAVQLQSRLKVIQDVMRSVMVQGVDYGVLPGTDKPSLFKPGAEKLCVTFRLSAAAPVVDELPTLTGGIRYRLHVPVHASNGAPIAVGVGECSTDEEKYAWRRPVHANEYLAAAEDRRREKWQRNGDVWQQVRVNPADVANTVLKMAHKRAYVHAVIMATAAGSIFTQDVEDLPDGVATEDHDQRPAVAKPAAPATPQRKAPASAAPAGAKTARVYLKDISAKQGTNAQGGWKKWTLVAADGTRFGTFDVKLEAIARHAWSENQPLDITYTEGPYGNDVVSLSAASAREPGSDDQ